MDTKLKFVNTAPFFSLGEKFFFPTVKQNQFITLSYLQLARRIEYFLPRSNCRHRHVPVYINKKKKNPTSLFIYVFQYVKQQSEVFWQFLIKYLGLRAVRCVRTRKANFVHGNGSCFFRVMWIKHPRYFRQFFEKILGATHCTLRSNTQKIIVGPMRVHVHENVFGGSSELYYYLVSNDDLIGLSEACTAQQRVITEVRTVLGTIDEEFCF